MAGVYPFRAIQFGHGSGDVSARIAPPYDVLDADDKAGLLARDAHNIVAIDLPHLPPKELGPPKAYADAAAALTEWIGQEVLTQRATPAMFAYRQRFEFLGKTFERCGMSCCIETVPFGQRPGGGVLAHEQTFSGPKEDRLALMAATKTQLSPIFGLFADDQGTGSALVREVMGTRPPDQTGTIGEITNEVWTIDDEATIAAYRDALDGQDIFIADGHHRYTTAINYLKTLEEQGTVPDDHPARRTMIVLVGMADPGLAIGPTHRVLGGMADYSFERFAQAAGDLLTVTPIAGGPETIEREIEAAALARTDGATILGLIDLATGSCHLATTTSPDPLAERFADKTKAWRTLDVAIVQHLIVEQICQPALNNGQPVTWAFPHTVDEVMAIAGGAETGAGGGAGFAQLAVIVRPTPLDAVRQISKAGELMPQKSTFFYPKLATGLWLNPLA